MKFLAFSSFPSQTLPSENSNSTGASDHLKTDPAISSSTRIELAMSSRASALASGEPLFWFPVSSSPSHLAKCRRVHLRARQSCCRGSAFWCSVAAFSPLKAPVTSGKNKKYFGIISRACSGYDVHLFRTLKRCRLVRPLHGSLCACAKSPSNFSKHSTRSHNVP